MSKIWHWFLISSVSLLVLSVVTWPDDKLHLVVCDVGQGDAILIYKGFTQVLIDGGPSSKVMSCLSNNLPWFDKNIEMVVMTHPQQDHMGGLLEVFENYNISILLAGNVSNSSKFFKSLYSSVLEDGVRVYSPVSGDRLRVGDLPFDILWPKSYSQADSIWNEEYVSDIEGGVVLGAYDGDLNETSLVLGLEYGKISMLFTGDIGTRQEQALVGSGVIARVDVLKVAHHGSKFSSSMDFIEATRPKWAVISVGENNRFGHPTREVLMYLDAVDSQVLRTDEMGEIELVSDGEEIWRRD